MIQHDEVRFTRAAGRYVAGLVQRMDPIRMAVILASLGNQKYRVRFTDNGNVIDVTAGQAETYIVGKEVILRVGGSGRYASNTAHILGYSQDADNGVIRSLLSTTTEKSGETITDMTPYPVQLKAGGLPGAVNVTGVRLNSAATYGHASIVDSVAQIIDSVLIRLQPRANAACPKGRYTLTVAGVTVPDYFEVV